MISDPGTASAWSLKNTFPRRLVESISKPRRRSSCSSLRVNGPNISGERSWTSRSCSLPSLSSSPPPSARLDCVRPTGRKCFSSGSHEAHDSCKAGCWRLSHSYQPSQPALSDTCINYYRENVLPLLLCLLPFRHRGL